MHLVELSRVGWITVIAELAVVDAAVALRVDRLLIESRAVRPALALPAPIASAVWAAWERADGRMRSRER